MPTTLRAPNAACKELDRTVRPTARIARPTEYSREKSNFGSIMMHFGLGKNQLEPKAL